MLELHDLLQPLLILLALHLASPVREQARVILPDVEAVRENRRVLPPSQKPPVDKNTPYEEYTPSEVGCVYSG